MSRHLCQHGNVTGDTVGEYRCYECEPVGPGDLPSQEQLELLRNLTPCHECGVVFVNRDACGEHLCAGKQGR